MKIYCALFIRFVQSCCILVVGFLGVCATPPQKLPFGHYCADVHTELKSGKACDEVFSKFVDRIIEDKTELSLRDWETIAFLVRDYVQIRIKQENHTASAEILKKLLSVASMPYQIKSSIRLSWQKLNPDGVPLRELTARLHDVNNFQATLEDHLLLQLYNMTLHSSYDDRKQEVLLAKERGDYDEALRLCHQLKESIEAGVCSPHPDILPTERFFLNKTILALQLEKSRDDIELCASLLLSYCRAEKDYVQSIESLVLRISQGEVNRANEVDVVLLAHALYTLPWDQKQAIHELEVLIDHGNYLQSTLLCYGYFSLLEIHYQNKNFEEIRKLLCAGEKVFLSNHPYFPEYSFFLASYHYEKQDYEKSQEIFLSILKYAAKLGVTLARVYEYLGCIHCLHKQYSEAEDFFLKAYKGWNRQEAGLGLFLTYALQGKSTLCEEFLSRSSFSFAYHNIVKSVTSSFLKREDASLSPFVKVCTMLHRDQHVSLSDIYYHCIYDMIKRYPICHSHPILSLIDLQLVHAEQEYFEKIQDTIRDSDFRRALTFWLDFRGGKLPVEHTRDISLTHPESLEEIALCCFYALYSSDSVSGDALSQVFSSECSSLQSVIRWVWALTRSSCNQEELRRYCEHLSLRPFGDRLYLLAYDVQEYFSKNEQALTHLSAFSDFFPNSSLLPAAYYFQSCAEDTLMRKISWLTRALQEFSEITLSGENAKPWAYIYYTVKLDLANAYLALGETTRAKEVFEEVKQDWTVPNHPQLTFIEDSCVRISMEMRWVIGLAYVYERLQERNLLIHHLLEHIEKRLLNHSLRREYVGEMLMKTVALCERFLVTEGSNSMIG
ncbi:hypothetical protein BOKEGFJH_00635 [Chlamydia avium]|nr:hypothetical protein BOKEGFJH_00635 [Chlamydia avium]